MRLSLGNFAAPSAYYSGETADQWLLNSLEGYPVDATAPDYAASVAHIVWYWLKQGGDPQYLAPEMLNTKGGNLAKPLLWGDDDGRFGQPILVRDMPWFIDQYMVAGKIPAWGWHGAPYTGVVDGMEIQSMVANTIMNGAHVPDSAMIAWAGASIGSIVGAAASANVVAFIGAGISMFTGGIVLGSKNDEIRAAARVQVRHLHDLYDQTQAQRRVCEANGGQWDVEAGLCVGGSVGPDVTPPPPATSSSTGWLLLAAAAAAFLLTRKD